MVFTSQKMFVILGLVLTIVGLTHGEILTSYKVGKNTIDRIADKYSDQVIDIGITGTRDYILKLKRGQILLTNGEYDYYGIYTEGYHFVVTHYGNFMFQSGQTSWPYFWDLENNIINNLYGLLEFPEGMENAFSSLQRIKEYYEAYNDGIIDFGVNGDLFTIWGNIEWEGRASHFKISIKRGEKDNSTPLFIDKFYCLDNVDVEELIKTIDYHIYRRLTPGNINIIWGPREQH